MEARGRGKLTDSVLDAGASYENGIRPWEMATIWQRGERGREGERERKGSLKGFRELGSWELGFEITV